MQAVRADFPAFLQDHASCEKKASGMALSVASHYPDKPNLLRAMADLAVEELGHYREVVRLMLERGVTPGADSKDPYVGALNGEIRQGSDNYLLDRLLVGAVVEARGYERFDLLATHLTEPAMQKFYAAIAASERRHWQLFVQLALEEFDAARVIERLQQLIHREAALIAAAPLRPALH